MRLKRLVACLVVLGLSVSMVSVAGAMGKAPKKVEAQNGAGFVQLQQYDYSGQPDCENTKTILVDMETDDTGDIYAIYKRYIFAADCQAMMVNPPGLLVKSDPELNELWRVVIRNGRPLALGLTDTYVWVLSYAVPFVGPTCKYAITRVPREGGLAQTECLVSSLTLLGGGTPDGLSALYDIDRGLLGSDTFIAGGSKTVNGVPRPCVVEYEFPLSDGVNILREYTDPDLTGSFVKIVISQDGTVACLTSRDEITHPAQSVVFLAEGSNLVKRAFCALEDDNVYTTLALSTSSDPGMAVAAGYKENGPEGGMDACLVAIDPETGDKIDTLIFGSSADDKINDVKFAQAEPNYKYKLLVGGETDDDLFGAGQSTSGFIADIQMDYMNLLSLTSGSQFAAEGSDVTANSIGPGVFYLPRIMIAGTTTGDLVGGDPSTAAVRSFIGIIDLRNPVQMIEALIAKVESMNLHQGIENSLDAKLENTKKSIESVKAGQRQDAANKIQAFVNECYAQRGVKLTIAQADELIADGNAIINALQQ